MKILPITVFLLLSVLFSGCVNSRKPAEYVRTPKQEAEKEAFDILSPKE